MKVLRTVGAIGDIHTEDIRLKAALEFLGGEGVDLIVGVGDIADGPGDLLCCCQLLQKHEVDVVAGNHDRWLLNDETRSKTASRDAQDRAQDFLEALPATRSYDTEAGRLLLCHGLGENDMNHLTPDDYGYALESNDELQELLSTQQYKFVINGHTHQRMVKDFGGVTIINVGTLFREHSPCFGRIDFADREVVFYSVASNGQIAVSSRHDL